MKMKTIYKQLDVLTVRMEKVFLLAGMLNDDDAMPDQFRDFLEFGDDDELRRCFPDMPESVLAERDNGDDAWRDAFIDWAHKAEKLGFMIQFARPLMRWSPNLQDGTYSWGHYSTRWVYGDTLAQAVALGKKWANEREAAEKAKATAADNA